jgi:enoyl-CoA hydratase/carnithine racemase
MELPVLISADGPVRIFRLNRPAARNAIDARTARLLREVWLAFEADPGARVGILTGGDQVFCAGADLKDLEALAADVTGEHGPLGFTRLAVSKPTIAAVAGYCVAGGLELACWCDLRIADETAVFGCFERRFGVPLVDGGTQRLPRIVGLGRALGLILTGTPVTAPEALAMGLVNEVVPRGQALARAVELARMVAAFPQTALRNDRQAVYGGLGLPLEEGLRLEARLGARTLASGEAAAGAQAFRQGKGRGGSFRGSG